MVMLKSLSLGALAALVTLIAPPSSAQTKEQLLEAFSGNWVVFDTAFSTSSTPCSLSLENKVELHGVVEESQLRPVANSQNCVVPLNSVSAWDIEQNQLVLYAQQDVVVARLGGNQSRVTGDLSDSFVSLILERPNGDAYQAAFSQAVRQHRCIYLGYTSDCAERSDLAAPVMSEDGGVVASLGLLVNLNVRDQPRRDARIVGTLPQGACLKVNYCTVASDGIWCRARFGEASGWVSKTALRQEKWPVATFVNGCEAE
ncbi:MULTISPECIES: SH3 domain-containing protein [Rhodobacterales]|jgi:hypothetical protein|nr:SH3 domain-containing protein [Phaeobacter gallaeciensis]MEE2817956.1 SH3 domain-containing protein [Pseudomonadota bacterium]PVZ46709.1 hypothetical protein DD556_10655 [Phaeobacter sp. JL2872]MDE4060683.1 SH3 domain-containing protein [Phaeobacter gallaeciensis]MDE4123890.1 SH3 domain-containing protein [Phaeobacter gallaeciensis]MDE4128172.1 SH3 domain-containing protein [Phaeobacter gallaeciensis]